MRKLTTALKNPTIQQYGLELLFPIVGYLFFDLSFLLVIFFYLVDQLGNQINFFARVSFVENLFRPKLRWLFPAAIFLFVVLFVAEIILIGLFFKNNIYDCQSTFFASEIKSFFLKEFWLFLPLLVFLNYFKDKMTFYKSDLPYQESPQKMVIFKSISIFNAFALIGFIYVIWLLLKPAIIIILILVALFKLLNDAFLVPELKVRYFKKI